MSVRASCGRGVALYCCRAFAVCLLILATFSLGGNAEAQNAPTIIGVEVTSDPFGRPFPRFEEYAAGDRIQVTVTFDRNVAVTGKPSIELTVGDMERQAVYSSGSGETSLVFEYAVVAGDRDEDGIVIPAGGLSLNDGMIQGEGVDVDLMHDGVAAPNVHRVNVRPKITRTWVHNDGGSDNEFLTGDVIQIRVWIDKVVRDATGSPSIVLDVGRGKREAIYKSRLGTNILRFDYRVTEADVDIDGVSISSGRVQLNDGVIQDWNGNDAKLTHELGYPAYFRNRVNIPLELVSAAMDGKRLVLKYGKLLDAGSVPPANSFTVFVGGNTVEIPQTTTAVAVSGMTVTVMLGNPVSASDTVTISYAKPTGVDATPIQDLAGVDADDFTGEPVSNRTMGTPSAPTGLTAVPVGDGAIRLSWMPPAVDGGSELTHYEYRRKEADGAFTLDGWGNDSQPGVTSRNIGGLTNGKRYIFQVRAVNALGGGAPSTEASVRVGPGFCSRTQHVQDAVLRKLRDVDVCTAVTDEYLAAITEPISIFTKTITSLKVGDFHGLSKLLGLGVANNNIVGALPLPVGVFDGLTQIRWLTLDRNGLNGNQLPVGIFDGLAQLQTIWLNQNQIDYLPDDIFRELGDTLTILRLQWNQLRHATLPKIDHLVKLKRLSLGQNNIAFLTPGMFDTFPKMLSISLYRNELKELPPRIFDTMPLLESLWLYENEIKDLPVDYFDRLTALTDLRIYDNPFYKDSLKVAPEELPIDEGGSGEYRLRLNSEPSGEVVVTVTSGNPGVTVKPTTLTFTTANWFWSQAVTVTADRDEDMVDSETVVSHALSGYGPSTGLSVAVATKDVQLMPTITGVAITSDPGPDGTYVTGDVIRITVTFDRSVTVTGMPSLTLVVGSKMRKAVYASDSGGASPVFEYTVDADDRDDDGVVVAGDLSLNGGMVQSLGGVDAALTHRGVAAPNVHGVNSLPVIGFALGSLVYQPGDPVDLPLLIMGALSRVDAMLTFAAANPLHLSTTTETINFKEDGTGTFKLPDLRDTEEVVTIKLSTGEGFLPGNSEIMLLRQPEFRDPIDAGKQPSTLFTSTTILTLDDEYSVGVFRYSTSTSAFERVAGSAGVKTVTIDIRKGGVITLADSEGGPRISPVGGDFSPYIFEVVISALVPMTGGTEEVARIRLLGNFAAGDDLGDATVHEGFTLVTPGVGVTVTPGFYAHRQSESAESTPLITRNDRLNLPPLPDGTGVDAVPTGVFDFIVRGLLKGGFASVLIELPVKARAGLVYHKYQEMTGRWVPFALMSGTHDRIFSAPAPCPSHGARREPVEDAAADRVYAWRSAHQGVREGDKCLLLEIQDGGLNDADQTVNGVVFDPGALASVGGSGTGGGGAMNTGWLVLLAIAMILGMAMKRNRAQIRLGGWRRG